MNLNTKIGNFYFENCLMNASGCWCNNQKELDELMYSISSTFITKSCTQNPSFGNPYPRYMNLKLGSINSMGLPNLGLNFYLNYSLMSSKVNFISLSGLSIEENLNMIQQIQESTFNGILEINLSCPNVIGKSQIGYDFNLIKIFLNKIFNIYKKTCGVKLPPYFDITHFEKISEILNEFPIQFITTINSVPNGLYINQDQEKVVIKPNKGYGGIGGEYIKPTALANVRIFYQLLKNNIDIIGCGGIKNGKDAFEHILCGASMLQIGTQLIKDGTIIFKKIKNELLSIMKKKGYKSINDFKGKLKLIE